MVEIGGMAWFAENLAFEARDSFCYDDDEANCRIYGRLYRWERALSACPPGAHLASEREWQALERAVGLPDVELEQRRDRGTVEGARLKLGGESGFDVLYGGWRRYEADPDRYSAAGENAAFWTSTETDLAHAQHRDIDVGDDMIWRSPVVKHYALSVRCVVDRYDEDEYQGGDTSPAFSPDGARIAYLSNREGVEVGRDIYLLDLRTKHELRLTFGDDVETVAWSPDGSTIAFESHREGNDEIYAMSVDGSKRLNLTGHPASDRSPAYTRDGRFLVFSSDRDGDRELYRMSIDEGWIERLTDQPGDDDGPSLSPQGERIAFVSDRDGNGEVYILELASGTTRRLTDEPLAHRSPVWSADGSELVVTYGDSVTGSWSLVLLSADGGDREVLFEGIDGGRVSWRASDGVLAFGAPTRGGEDEEPGKTRIHLAVPKGAGPQPITGRLAGVVSGEEVRAEDERLSPSSRSPHSQ